MENIFMMKSELFFIRATLTRLDNAVWIGRKFCWKMTYSKDRALVYALF